jgi:hypothetical protein
MPHVSSSFANSNVCDAAPLPALASERGKALRALLYLFERDDAVRLTDAG